MEVNTRQVIYDFIIKTPFLLGFLDLISGFDFFLLSRIKMQEALFVHS